MEKNTKSAASATKTATATAKSAAKTTTPTATAAPAAATPAAPALRLVKSVIVPPIGGTPAEAKPATPAKTETKPAAPAKVETKPAAETKQEKPTEAAKEAPKTETPQEQPAKETPKEATPAPAAAAPAAETEQKPAEPAPAPMSAEEAAAAAIRAAEEADRKRRESLAEMQKRLDEELEKLNHKREIAEKREMFIKCREDIENYIGELEEETEFETSICRLSFERFTKDGLNREEFKKVMTVSNTAIVKKFCEAMSAEICAKVGEIENELLTA